MAKFSYAELQSLVATAVTEAKISNASFSATYNNIVGLLDKIGKIVTLDSNLAIDKLARFDGEYLSFGKTIEEWQQDLILPEDYDSTGAHALSPHDPTYRPNFYSYSVGKKVIKSTIRNNDIERAVHFVEQFNEIVAMQYKRITDSMAQYRYGVKREMLGRWINMAISAMTTTGSNAWNAGTARDEGTYVYYTDSGVTTFGIVVKAYKTTDNKTFAEAVAGGWVVVFDLVSELAQPSDDSTAEAFLQALKIQVEKAQDISDGASLNGNTLGAIDGLVLVCKQGILPVVDVKAFAGAFHEDRLNAGVEQIVVKDFGDSAPADVYAVLIDGRGMRLHNTYRATRENMNGDGDFLNIFLHTEDTAWVSRNAFIHVFMKPQA